MNLYQMLKLYKRRTNIKTSASGFAQKFKIAHLFVFWEWAQDFYTLLSERTAMCTL